MIASGLSSFARGTIGNLGLERHPEGGWYRRTWQSATPVDPACVVGVVDMGEHAADARPLASLIYFLLPAGDASAWHVVDADEIWLWHGPGIVTIELGGTGEVPNESSVRLVTLGILPDGSVCGHFVIPAGTWQRTLPASEDVLVSCVVSPGFVYAGFALA